MKILHVDSGREWRGGQNQALLSTAGMVERGHDVTLACRRGSALQRRAERAHLSVAPVDFGGELSPRPAWQVGAIVRAVRPQVIQAHDPHALTAALLGGLMRVPVVATRRVDFAPRGPLARRKYRLCPRVIAVSMAIRGVLLRAGVDESALRLVYEGVPDRPAQPGGREVLRSLGLPEGAPVIGNVAALVDHKDHKTLIRAAGIVCGKKPDVHFVIVGDGLLREALERMVADLGLREKVVFTGFRDDIDRLLPAFDVFCLTSHMEGLGTIVLDAMAFGRPVVATAAGGIPESVADGVTGLLVPVRDAEAVAGALLALLENPARAEAFGQAGRRRFSERFSSDRMISETLAVYEELL